MTTMRLRSRLAAAATVTALVGTGALATAPSAAAKANVLTLNKVSLQQPGLRADVTYSCDKGMNHRLVANATTLDRPGHDQSIAAGTLKIDQLVCDYADHKAQVTLRPAVGSHFAKGDKVKVTLFYFDEDGFSYAQRETVAVL
ncbi:hypothetical protein ACFCVY_05850 [Streptomyces sp. NPDC056411]|uniref:hypothetical protein n=1 Tax=Streptomyces sp. NPDC056411 TaxID=3345813 RepID=UPI0035E15690